VERRTDVEAEKALLDIIPIVFIVMMVVGAIGAVTSVLWGWRRDRESTPRANVRSSGRVTEPPPPRIRKRSKTFAIFRGLFGGKKV